MFTCERGERVGLAGGGRDASVGEPVVGRKGLEELDGGLEERDGLSALRAARGQTRGVEGAVARSVGSPLVLWSHISCRLLWRTEPGAYLPELLVGTIIGVVEPVLKQGSVCGAKLSFTVSVPGP